MGANLWDPVVQLLDGEFGCVTPELPFGVHPTPMAPDADLTTAGRAGTLTPLLASLKFRVVDQVRAMPEHAHARIARRKVRRDRPWLEVLALDPRDPVVQPRLVVAVNGGWR